MEEGEYEDGEFRTNLLNDGLRISGSRKKTRPGIVEQRPVSKGRKIEGEKCKVLIKFKIDISVTDESGDELTVWVNVV